MACLFDVAIVILFHKQVFKYCTYNLFDIQVLIRNVYFAKTRLKLVSPFPAVIELPPITEPLYAGGFITVPKQHIPAVLDGAPKFPAVL